MRIKNREIDPFRVFYNIFPYLSMNNILKLRKINKNQYYFSNSFLGTTNSEMKESTRKKYL